MQVFELADRLMELRSEKERIGAEAKAVNDEIEVIEAKLVESMVEGELQNFTRSGKQFHLRSQRYVSCRADRKDDLHHWLRNNGYADLIGEAVHPSTLKSFVNEVADSDAGMPEDLASIVSMHTQTKVGVRSA